MAILKVRYFFSFGGFVDRPRQARPLALRYVNVSISMLACLVRENKLNVVQEYLIVLPEGKI